MAGFMNSLLMPVTGQETRIEVVGKVVDATSNDPLPGVAVVVKGTSIGTITDIDGNYSISVLPDAVLQFSFIGYLTEEVAVNNNTVINVNLVTDIIGLDEVIVTGYGVQKKSDVTGSIASVSSEKLTEIPVAGIDHALQGRAAGVNVVSQSGRPGESAKVQIRGITSINSADPLIIVDGVAFTSDILASLNADDIESIEVLKDASSAAIYGATGGNGVIILTTKKGQSGKMVTNFNFYNGVETVARKMDLMNSQQWLEVAEEVSTNDTAITSRPDTFPTYDWNKYIFQPAYTQNYDISFSGGSEKSNYMISSSYNDQEGIIRNSEYTRFTLRINSEHQMTKRLMVDEKIYYMNSVRDGFNDHLWHEYYDGPIRPAFQMAPFVPDYLPNGNWANSEDYGIGTTTLNPLAKLDMINRKERINLFEANMGAKLEIIKGLTFTSRFDGRMQTTESKEFQDAYFNKGTDRRLESEIKLLGSFQKDMSYYAQQYLTYGFSLANAHNFTLLLGMEAYQGWGYDMSGERNAMPSSNPNLLYFDMSTDRESTNQIIEGNGTKERALAYFGRINYDFKGKYLLTANLRRDGRSSFGPKNRIGYFPSVSVGWKFSEEEFMKNQNLISFAKVRYGYGESGAYPRSGTPYLSLIRSPMHFGYPFDNVTSSIGAAPVQIENKEIHWEPVITSNAGIDLAFWQNRLTLTAEYYSKINDGMLMLMDVPFVSGTYTMGADVDGDNTRPEVNIGSVRNSGFEFSIGYRKMEGDLKGSFDLNFSTIKNEILDLASDSMRRGAVHNVAPLVLDRIGGSISDFWGWETDGIFTTDDPTNSEGVFTNQPFYYRYDTEGNISDTIYAQPSAKPGDVRFKDVNGDGIVLTDEDKVILGSPIPKLVFGFSINLEYKGFDLSAFFNGTIGNKIFNGTKQYLYYYQGNTNRGTDFANRYVENDITKLDPITYDPVVVVHENRNTDLPRNYVGNYAKPMDFYIEDGSYLRLRNLILGYTFPHDLTQKIKVEKLRIYVGAKNLFTLTHYTGLNPEAGYTDPLGDGLLVSGVDWGSYPVTRMFLFGVNLSF
jgi:TonB-linked SusC/RagA family outer membrane protein